MPIKSEPYWFAVCDGCGERADYDEFTAWQTRDLAETSTEEIGWTSDGDKWRCPGCPPLDAKAGDAP